jgi:hypothetical protein
MFHDRSDDWDLLKGRSGCPPAKLDADELTSESAPQQRSIGATKPTTTICRCGSSPSCSPRRHGRPE